MLIEFESFSSSYLTIKLSFLILNIGLLSTNFPKVNSIGCYKCSSTTNDSTCIDPFNPGATSVNLYEQDCKAGIHDRIGLFPARYCLKVSGYKAGTNEQIVIRTCTVTKLLDSDSSHSSFTLKLEDGNQIQVVSGLIASCKDDGCNRADILFKSFNKRVNIFMQLFFYFIVILVIC